MGSSRQREAARASAPTRVTTPDIRRLLARPEHATLAALAAATVIAYVMLAPRRDFPSYDGTYYLQIARELLQGRLIYSIFPPGFPALIALGLLPLGAVTPEVLLRAALVVNGIAGIAFGLLAYAFARQVIARWPAVGVAGLCWVLPLPLRLATSDLSEPTYGCLLLLGLLLLERRRPVAGGLAWGMAYLVRPEAIVSAAAIAALQLPRRWRLAARLAAGTAVAVVPYLVYARAVTGRWTLSGKTVFLERALASPADADVAASYLQHARELIGMLSGTVGAGIVALALLGAVLRPHRWLAVAAPLLALPAFSFRMDARYWAPYLPLVLTCAWLGVERGLRLVPAARARVLVAAFAALLMVGNAAFTTATAMRQIAWRYEYYVGLRDAGRWLRSRAERTTLVAARKPYVSFWAGCEFARIPDGLDAAGIVDWAQTQHAQWLVVNVWEVRTVAPSMQPLSQKLPEEFRGRIEPAEMFLIEERPEQTTYLYRVLPRPQGG